MHWFAFNFGGNVSCFRVKLLHDTLMPFLKCLHYRYKAEGHLYYTINSIAHCIIFLEAPSITVLLGFNSFV